MSLPRIFGEPSTIRLNYDGDIRDLDRFLIRHRAANDIPVPYYYQHPFPSLMALPVEQLRLPPGTQLATVQLEPVRTVPSRGRFHRLFHDRLHSNPHFALWRLANRRSIRREVAEHRNEVAQDRRVIGRISSQGDGDLQDSIYTNDEIPSFAQAAHEIINGHPSFNFQIDDHLAPQEQEIDQPPDTRFRRRRRFHFGINERDHFQPSGHFNSHSIHRRRRSYSTGVRNRIAQRSRSRSRIRNLALHDEISDDDHDMSDQNSLDDGDDIHDPDPTRRSSSRHFFRRTFHTMLRRNIQEQEYRPTARPGSMFTDSVGPIETEHDPELRPFVPTPLGSPATDISAGSAIISSGSEYFQFTNEETSHLNHLSLAAAQTEIQNEVNYANRIQRGDMRMAHLNESFDDDSDDEPGIQPQSVGSSRSLEELEAFGRRVQTYQAPYESPIDLYELTRNDSTRQLEFRPFRSPDDETSLRNNDSVSEYSPDVPNAGLFRRSFFRPYVYPQRDARNHLQLQLLMDQRNNDVGMIQGDDHNQENTGSAPPIIQYTHSTAAATNGGSDTSSINPLPGSGVTNSRRNSSGIAMLMNQRRETDISRTQSTHSNRSDGNRDEVQPATMLRRSATINNSRYRNTGTELSPIPGSSSIQQSPSNEENSKHSTPISDTDSRGRRSFRNLRGSFGRVRDLYYMMGRYDDKSTDTSPGDSTNTTTSPKSHEVVLANSGTSSISRPRFSPLKLSPVNPHAFDFSDV